MSRWSTDLIDPACEEIHKISPIDDKILLCPVTNIVVIPKSVFEARKIVSRKMKTRSDEFTKIYAHH